MWGVADNNAIRRGHILNKIQSTEQNLQLYLLE